MSSPPFVIRMRVAVAKVSAKRLPVAHRCVLLVLATYARPDGSRCYPATATVRSDAGLGERRLFAVLGELEAAGWILREPCSDPKTGRRTSTLYHLYLRGSPIRRVRRTVRGLAVPTVDAEALEARGVAVLAKRRAASQ